MNAYIRLPMLNMSILLELPVLVPTWFSTKWPLKPAFLGVSMRRQ